MQKRTWLAGAGLLMTGALCLLFLGRNGEYAARFTFAAPVTEGASGAVRVHADGAVVRPRADPESPLELWATRPEFAVHVEGASPESPVLVHNALPLLSYEPTAPGARSIDGTLLALEAPGSFTFRPRPRKDYSFLVMGDPRDHLGGLERALTEPTDALFALCLGDLVSRGDPLQYAQVAAIAARAPLPVYFTVGNHDLEKGGRRFYRALFGDESYAFRVGRDLFAVLDTAADYPYLGDDRLGWLDRVLGEGDDRHRLVFFHTPPLDPRAGGDHRLRYVPLRRGLQRTLERQGVPLAFASHIHDYVEGEEGGVRYVITGGLGAGGDAHFPPHTVRVAVTESTVRWERIDLGAAPLRGVALAADPPPGAHPHVFTTPSPSHP